MQKYYTVCCSLFRPEHVKPDLMKTLEDLQLDYIDSFVIHWPQAVPSTGDIDTQRWPKSMTF